MFLLSQLLLMSSNFCVLLLDIGLILLGALYSYTANTISNTIFDIANTDIVKLSNIEMHNASIIIVRVIIYDKIRLIVCFAI
jgi:hypothetical protein